MHSFLLAWIGNLSVMQSVLSNTDLRSQCWHIHTEETSRRCCLRLREKRGKAMEIEKKERTVIDRPVRIRQPSEMLSDRDLGGAFLTCGWDWSGVQSASSPDEALEVWGLQTRDSREKEKMQVTTLNQTRLEEGKQTCRKNYLSPNCYIYNSAVCKKDKQSRFGHTHIESSCSPTLM